MRKALLKNCPLPAAYSLGGAVAAMLGWAAVEPFFQEGGCIGRIGPANAFCFPIVMGTIAGFLTAADSWSSGHRARILSQAWAGFGVSFVLAYLVQGPAHVLFAYLSPWRGDAHDWHPMTGGIVTLAPRGLAWAVIASVTGIAEGIVTRNWRTACGAALGASLGGLVAGLLFDPLHLLLHLGSGNSGAASRAVGMAITGGTAGFLAAVMADTAHHGTIRIVSGPLDGLQVPLRFSPCSVGSSRCCDVVLRDDLTPEAVYALIQKSGFHFEIQSVANGGHTAVNGKTVHCKKLAHGDRIRVGVTDMVFLDDRFPLQPSPEELCAG